MIKDTEQSSLFFAKGYVHKIYKKSQLLYDSIHFESEMASLKKLSGSKFFIDCFDVGDGEYKMDRYDFELGSTTKLNYDNLHRILFSLSITEILEDLDEILRLLKLNNIRHRDIHPGNLLYSEREKCLKLTDFYWSDDIDNKIDLPIPNKEHPFPLNGNYGTDDELAIKRIKTEIEDYYYVFVQQREKIQANFISSVGHGAYKDGSSVFKGYAYHIIDIPGFKEAITYHKNTCIEEYKVIKNTLPIIPETFIDIGAAEGYFTFNLLRDFDISRAYAYEADINVSSFLHRVKFLYRLPQLEVRGKFDDSINLYRDFDIAIWLNSHMWVYKQLGKEKALQCMANVLKHCKYMYFQTCGAYGSGMYKVAEYKNEEDIYHMLMDAGAKDVQVVAKFIGSHGAPRHMFLVQGEGV